MKIIAYLSLSTLLIVAHSAASEFDADRSKSFHYVNVQNLRPVENAFTGTMQCLGRARLSGPVTHVSVTPIAPDLRSAPRSEVAWFPDKYAIQIKIGDVRFYGREREIQYRGSRSLSLQGDYHTIQLDYVDEPKIVDAPTFESALKKLFGLYEGCPTPPAQFISYRVKENWG